MTSPFLWVVDQPEAAASLAGIAAQATLLKVAGLAAERTGLNSILDEATALLCTGLDASGCRIEVLVGGTAVTSVAGRDPSENAPDGALSVVTAAPIMLGDAVRGEIQLVDVSPHLARIAPVVAPVIASVLATALQAERGEFDAAILELVSYTALLQGELTDQIASDLHRMLLAVPGISRAAVAVGGPVALLDRGEMLSAQIGSTLTGMQVAVAFDPQRSRYFGTERAIRRVLAALAAGRLREDDLHRLSRELDIDALTGVGNRRRANNSLQLAVARAERINEPVSLILCDLDHFGDVNVIEGRSGGDRLLRRVGALLDSATRLYDTTSRLAEDSFVVVLPGTTKEDAVAVAERIRTLAPVELPAVGRAMRPTVSIGVAAYPADGDEPENLLSAAARALETAKAEGRNCVRT